MLRRVVLLLAIGSMLVFAAIPAYASRGTAYSSDGGAKSTWGYWPNTHNLAGTLSDLSAGNALCARVFVRGYSHVLGWESWKMRAKNCAGTHGPWIYNAGSIYSDHVQLKVCDGGTDTTGARCGPVARPK